MTQPNKFGRVDEQNNVFVSENGVERHVGQYLGVTPEEALAFYSRKFDDLEAQVRLLEQRLAASSGNPKGLLASYKKLEGELVAPLAVGDIVGLRARLAKLEQKIAAVSEVATKEQEEAIEAALNARAAIAATAEDIVAKLPNINWKKSSEEMNSLFLKWQELQKSGVKVPKGKSDAIWKRFSQARSKFEAGKRAFFAGLDGKLKDARNVKQALTERAESLVGKGGEAAAEYRKLLDEWKAAPRAGKAEDSLWERFKKAGDAIYSAKKEKDAELEVEQKANLEQKLLLLAEAEKIQAQDIEAARAKLSDIRTKWVAIGHVPRNEVRSIEDRLRKVEDSVKRAEEDRWRRSDPAAKDRSNSLVTQLEAVIAELEGELAKAPAGKKKDLQSQIEARKALLVAAKGAVD